MKLLCQFPDKSQSTLMMIRPKCYGSEWAITDCASGEWPPGEAGSCGEVMLVVCDSVDDLLGIPHTGKEELYVSTNIRTLKEETMFVRFHKATQQVLWSKLLNFLICAIHHRHSNCMTLMREIGCY